MQSLELGLFLLTGASTTAVLVLGSRSIGKYRFAFFLLLAFCLGGSVLWLPPDLQKQELLQEVPIVGREQFTGSDACRSCHIPHYDSWHRSYHRTMTQLASEQSIKAPFDGRLLDLPGIQCTVDRQGDWFTVEMADPDWEASEHRDGIERRKSMDAPRAKLPVVMTTGSHHLQAYWVPSIHGNKVRIFPWVYHLGMQRWIPNEDSFLNPPDSKRHSQIWNNNCILCHSVAGDTGYDPGDWKSSVAELGISCEACHGPGAEHVAKHRNPISRYAQRLSDQADSTIVNPARLPHTKSSEICGQCHTAFDVDASTPKNTYRAGGDFSIFTLANPTVDESFWADGTMRIGGREYSGMIESKCFQQGEMSCISCHSMHTSDPNKQMQPSMKGDHGCLQCHQDKSQNIAAHTHHAENSEGSRCYNCHMPFSSYALFGAVRSHRVDSPSVAISQSTGRPNACNQCHLDQTLAWTDQYLDQWYGIAQAKLSEDERTVAASLLWLLKGNAIQRVLAAWSLGWDKAVAASGKDWQAPFLAELLEDPYSMVRYMAQRSLNSLGHELPGYDFLPTPTGTARELVQTSSAPLNANLGNGVRSFYDATQQLNRQRVEQLLEHRDNRPVTLNE